MFFKIIFFSNFNVARINIYIYMFVYDCIVSIYYRVATARVR